MSTALKCPNPSCPYLFDPSSVPAGVLLACPRCGMRFTLGNPAPVYQPETVGGRGASPFETRQGPGGYPPAAPEPRLPTSPPVGYQTSPGQFSSEANFGAMATSREREPAETRPALPVRQSRLQAFILVAVSAMAIATAAIVVWYKLTHKNDEIPQDLVTRFKEVNLGFEPPPSPWVRDGEIRATLGSPCILVYKRDNPEAYMAFGAKDFDPRSPRESELVEGIMRPLSKILDISTLKQMEPLESTWMKQPVKGFLFRAQLKSGGPVQGEAYRLAYKGIGYWFLSWTGDNTIFDEMQPSFAEARRHCTLLDLRNDWKERQSATVPFKNNRIGYTLLDAEGIWEEEKDEANVKYEGETADKLLKIKVGKRKDELQDAQLIVYILPDSGDPLTEGRKYITDKRTKEIRAAGDYPVEFIEVTGAPEGDPILSPIENPTEVVRLLSKVKGATKEQNRFHVISALRVGDKNVVVHAWCSADKKEKLETTLMQIAGSLHSAK